MKKKTVKKREKDEIVSQCPECGDLKVWLAKSTYAPIAVPSVARFNSNIPKELCTKCLKKLDIDGDENAF